MKRWRRPALHRALLALAMALALVLVPGGGSHAGPPPTTPAAAPAPVAPSPAAGSTGSQPLASQGAYQLGKVRILGVPVITVAAPVLGQDGGGPDATTRAQVIEGNLAMLYRGRNLCSSGEALAEALVHRFLAQAPRENPCGLANASLLGSPDALTVEVVPLEDGLHRLEARVAGRPQPLPLLTVTLEDARLNGLSNGELAERWRGILQQRLRVARQLMQPRTLLRRWIHVVLAEGVLLGVLALVLWFWRWSRREAGRLEERFGAEGLTWRRNLAVQGVHGLSLGLLMVLSALLLTMAGVAVFAVPGQVPVALDLLLQPWGIAMKLLLVWVLALALQALIGLWLRQWVSQVSVAPAWRNRRLQRYRSLRHVLRRLVDVLCLLLAGFWILSGLPGVQELSGRAVIAGGALLGGLAIVFQGLLRDFVAGLTILFGDHFAIGDTVEIRGLCGEVTEMGVLSTELRCADQRLAIFPNSSCGQMVNHTKLRSGAEVTLTLAQDCGDLRRALEVIRSELGAFTADPTWQPSLLQPPDLRGVTAEGPGGITVSVLLVTEAGTQGPAGRELRLRLLERLHREGIPLATGGTS